MNARPRRNIIGLHYARWPRVAGVRNALIVSDWSFLSLVYAWTCNSSLCTGITPQCFAVAFPPLPATTTKSQGTVSFVKSLIHWFVRTSHHVDIYFLLWELLRPLCLLYLFIFRPHSTSFSNFLKITNRITCRMSIGLRFQTERLGYKVLLANMWRVFAMH